MDRLEGGLTWTRRILYKMDTVNGKELKRLRRALGMTQRELGEALELHSNTLARAERNEIPVPRTTLFAARYLLLTRKKTGGSKQWRD